MMQNTIKKIQSTAQDKISPRVQGGSWYLIIFVCTEVVEELLEEDEVVV